MAWFGDSANRVNNDNIDNALQHGLRMVAQGQSDQFMIITSVRRKFPTKRCHCPSVR